MWIIVVAVIVFFIFLYEKSTEIKKSVEDKEVERDRARLDHAHSIATAAAMATAKAAALVAANSLAEFQAIKREAAESTALSIAIVDAAYAAKASALAKANSVAVSEAIKREAAETVARSLAKVDSKVTALATAKAASLAAANSISESYAIKREAADAVTRSITKAYAAHAAEAAALATAKTADLTTANSIAESKKVQREAAEAIARSVAMDAAKYAALAKAKSDAEFQAMQRESSEDVAHYFAMDTVMDSDLDAVKSFAEFQAIQHEAAEVIARAVAKDDHDAQAWRDAKKPIVVTNEVESPVDLIESFLEIKMKAAERFIFSKTEKDILHGQLKRGTKILDSQEELDTYIYKFGSMHERKLTLAYEALHESENLIHLASGKNIQIIDYACGQGLASMLFIEFLKKKRIDCHIDKAVLVEPSKLALEGCASRFTGNTVRINKKFDDLVEQDIATKKSCTKFHLFSNILDMGNIHFNPYVLANKIINSQKGTNYFICVSALEKRKLDDFMYCFDEHILISSFSGQIVNPSKHPESKPWKVEWNIFKVEL